MVEGDLAGVYVGAGGGGRGEDAERGQWSWFPSLPCPIACTTICDRFENVTSKFGAKVLFKYSNHGMHASHAWA